MKYIITIYLILVVCTNLLAQITPNPFGACRYTVNKSDSVIHYFALKVSNDICPNKIETKYIEVDKLPDGFILNTISYISKLMESKKSNQYYFNILINSSKHSKKFFKRISTKILENRSLKIIKIELKYEPSNSFFYTEVILGNHGEYYYSIKLVDIDGDYKIVGITELL